MGPQNSENKAMDIVLSTDAKPRLKWTPELHLRFVAAVIQLGGADKTTPKGLMKAMGIPGLTLYHLKSHLQKYRLEKNQPAEPCSDIDQDDCKDSRGSLDVPIKRIGEQTSNSVYKSRKIVHAIHVQMEVQRKLHDQMEVQKHLQLRIEAQGKYLQKVLRKAQETLSAYTLSSIGIEHSISGVNSGCSTPSLSDLTEEARPLILDEDEDAKKSSHTPIVLELLDQKCHSNYQIRKRKGEGNNDENEVSKKQSTYKENMGSRLNEMGLFGTIDLNSHYQEDPNLELTTIDLNSIVVGHGLHKI